MYDSIEWETLKITEIMLKENRIIRIPFISLLKCWLRLDDCDSLEDESKQLLRGSKR